MNSDNSTNVIQGKRRSDAFAINTQMKKDIVNESGINDHMTEEEKRLKVGEVLEKNLKNNNKAYNRFLDIKNDNSIDIPPPQYNDIKKEYYTKNEKVHIIINAKPIFFHEKAKIIGGLDKRVVGEIEPYNQVIDFQNFLYEFKFEDEVQSLEIQDLLDIDYERLKELKFKALEFIDATSMLIEEKKQDHDSKAEEELVLFFTEKLQVKTIINL